MAEHVCVDCRALPALPDGPVDIESVEYRPVRARPAPHGGPRSRRCTTHWRRRRAAHKARTATTRRAGRYGVTPELFDALWAIQGRACPCGRQPRRRPDTDHDHGLAATHDHPVDYGCPECVRGLLCRACNREVLGRYNADQLRALADYLDDPPMARLRRQEAAS